jgi:hypothetical protein
MVDTPPRHPVDRTLVIHPKNQRADGYQRTPFHTSATYTWVHSWFLLGVFMPFQVQVSWPTESFDVASVETARIIKARYPGRCASLFVAVYSAAGQYWFYRRMSW